MGSSPGRFPVLRAGGLLLLAVLAVLGDVLAGAASRVLSHFGTDLSFQFVFWRDFGFSQLRQGNLALWNPYIYSGMPFFGGFQSALLYPPNWIYCFLSLGRAINWGIALHLVAAGVFTFLWARRRLSFLPSLLAAFLFTFSGSHYLHVLAGHLPNLCTIAWVPLLFWSLDRFFEERSRESLLWGMLAVSMQVLAGHPQYLFYTGVAVALYSGLELVRAKRRIRLMLGLFALYGGAALLTAVQLLTGMAAAAESVRSGGLSYEMASMFSFPPENFLTLLSPALFGDILHFPYWGRWYLYEVCLFFGVTGLFLALYGALFASPSRRGRAPLMSGLLLLLALGAYSPLFPLLYHWVPGFSSLRGNAKFITLASLFLSLLAGAGLQSLEGRARRGTRSALAGAATLILAGAGWISWSSSHGDGLWERLVRSLVSSGQSYLAASQLNRNFVSQAGSFAAWGLVVAAGTLLASALILTLAHKRRTTLLAGLAILEVLVFARIERDTFDLARVQYPELRELVAREPGEGRVLFLENPNATMSLGKSNLWGHDPGLPRGYAEFMAFSQGLSSESAGQYLQIRRLSPLFRLLRCRQVWIPRNNSYEVRVLEPALSHLNLVREWTLIPQREALRQALLASDFDPRRRVLLQQDPGIASLPGPAAGEARITESSTDELVVEASLTAPSILLLSDPYDAGWRARPLPGSVQSDYRILPADEILMAIPLEAGEHHLRIEYLPPAFVLGKWISILALLGYAWLAILCWRARRSSSRNGTAGVLDYPSRQQERDQE